MFLFISWPEIGFIIFIVVLLFGADKIPDFARNLGKGINNIKHATNEIKQYTGDAIAIIPKLKFDFDMVFLDADKENYVKYLELISPILKPGGVLLTDNVLWHGKILESPENQDRVTSLIDNFNKKILEDKSLKTVMLPIRDGISLTLKL